MQLRALKLSLFVGLALFTLSLCQGSANATPIITSQSWTGVPAPAPELYTHYNGALTTFRENGGCGTTSDTSTTPNIVTRFIGSATNYTVDNESNGWKVLSCTRQRATGLDGTAYFVQRSNSNSEIRVAAKRGNSILWTRILPNGGCNYAARVNDMALGYDNNLYLSVRYSSCNVPDIMKLVSINSETGDFRYQTTLPANTSPSSSGMLGDEVMPYPDGVAVVNNGVNAYYFSYTDGSQNTSLTFSPSVPSGSSVVSASGSPTGRVYLLVNTPTVRKLYYKDVASSTIQEITPSVGGDYIINVYPAPNNQTVLRWYKNSAYGVTYLASNDSENFSKNLQSDNGDSLTGQAWVTVNSEGKVITARTMNSGSERRVYVDSFSSSGTQTRLMNSDTEFGTSTTDKFSTNSFLPENLGDGTINLVLCHTTGYSQYPNCPSSEDPLIVTITDSASFSYPRSSMFTAAAAADQDSDGLSAYKELLQSTSDLNSDSDTDGLSDYVESTELPDRNDLFCNSSVTLCDYPTPTQRDLYIEADWMVKPAVGNEASYSMQLTTSQANAIEASYASKGILAHIDYGQLSGGNEVPYNLDIHFLTQEQSADFYDYKHGGNGIDPQFDTDRYQIYHYLLLGYHYNEYPGSTGAAIPGDDDAFISYGLIKEAGSYTSFSTAIEGTIMHELGHNLCLTPGVVSGYDNQPASCRFAGIHAYTGSAYPSVMNYDQQLSLVDYSSGPTSSGDHDDWGALRLQDFALSNVGDPEAGVKAALKDKPLKKKNYRVKARPIFEQDVRKLKQVHRH